MINLNNYILEKLKLKKEYLSKSNLTFPFKLYIKWKNSVKLDNICIKSHTNYNIILNKDNIKYELCRIIKDEYIYSLTFKNEEDLNDFLMFLILYTNSFEEDEENKGIIKTPIDLEKTDEIKKYIDNYIDIEDHINNLCINKDFLKKLQDSLDIYNLPF
jgi:hypothetical protein